MGPEQISTLDTVHNLGSLYSEQWKLKEAEERYQQALEGYKKALGPDHPQTYFVADNLSSLASSSAERDASNPMHQDNQAAQALEANILRSSVPERSHRRNMLHRVLRRK
jgi:tetratricopeptide (TPR) repeat protein